MFLCLAVINCNNCTDNGNYIIFECLSFAELCLAVTSFLEDMKKLFTKPHTLIEVYSFGSRVHMYGQFL